MEFTESRFPHLLQPIRELTKNWEIDVASELNDYLEELDTMCITFDGGKTRLNFAEAALLIQGSACIYSKKVELLHSLVYQTLEYINDRNKKRSKQTADSQEDEAAGAAGDHNAECVVRSRLFWYLLNQRYVHVTGDVLSSQKDFRINLFVPGAEDMILLTLGSSRLLLDPADPLQQRGAALGPGPGARDWRSLVSMCLLRAGEEAPAEAAVADSESFTEVFKNVSQAPSEEPMIRERRPVRETPVRTEETPPVNVWTLSDPYAVLEEDKPFRPGKCHKVPEGLDDGGKRKRRRAASLQDFRSWFRRTCEKQFCVSVYTAEMKMMMKVVMVMFLFQLTLRKINTINTIRSMCHIYLCVCVQEQLVVTCRGYTQETALSRRVKDWEDKIRPELVLQEQRSVFDIRDYGDRIVSALSGVGQRRSFSSIVSGLNNYEACKYLLASLQLANDLTVELDSAGHLEAGVDTLGLKLLSTQRATDRFRSAPT
uniref:Condensin-2 complex subunit H2 n=1 Tax=Cyclopterus lumpus TaxID=8103 RepID=A0A8C3A9Z8_CYCLU